MKACSTKAAGNPPMCIADTDNLDINAHKSTAPLRSKSATLSIEGDYAIITTGGGCERSRSPARSLSRSTEGGEANVHGAQRPIGSFYRMARTISGVIRASCFVGSDRRAAFSTFTYSSEDADLQRAKHDSGLLIRRLKYVYPSLEHMRVLEPHEKGDWHIHAVLLLPEGVTVSSARSAANDAWSHGRTHTEAVTDANGLAYYLSPLSAKKRSRQHFYLPGVRNIFVSQRMPRPKVIRGLSEAEARKKVRSLGGLYIDTHTFGPPGENMGRKEFYRII